MRGGDAAQRARHALRQRAQVLRHVADLQGPEEVARPLLRAAGPHVAPALSLPGRAQQRLREVLARLHLATGGGGDDGGGLHRALQRARVDAGHRSRAQVLRDRLRLEAPAVGEAPAALAAVDDLLWVVHLAVADEVEDGHTATTWPSAVNSTSRSR